MTVKDLSPEALEKHRAYHREAQKRWRARHPEKAQANNRKGNQRRQQLIQTDEQQRLKACAQKRSTAARRWLKLLALFGGCCTRCGFADSRALQIDHVNGGGKAHRAQFKGPRSYYRDIANRHASGEFQLLCANCNQIKKIECRETAIGMRNLAGSRTRAKADCEDHGSDLHHQAP